MQWMVLVLMMVVSIIAYSTVTGYVCSNDAIGQDEFFACLGTSRALCRTGH